MQVITAPWEVERGTTQPRQVQMEALPGHWVPGWGSVLENTIVPQTKGTVGTLLFSCPSLSPTRLVLADYTNRILKATPQLVPLVNECLALDHTQFWLDCSTMAPVISAVQMGVGETLIFRPRPAVLDYVKREMCEDTNELENMNYLEEMSEDTCAGGDMDYLEDMTEDTSAGGNMNYYEEDSSEGWECAYMNDSEEDSWPNS